MAESSGLVGFEDFYLFPLPNSICSWRDSAGDGDIAISCFPGERKMPIQRERTCGAAL